MAGSTTTCSVRGPAIALMQYDNSQLPAKDRASDPLWPWMPDYSSATLEAGLSPEWSGFREARIGPFRIGKDRRSPHLLTTGKAASRESLVGSAVFALAALLCVG